MKNNLDPTSPVTPEQRRRFLRLFGTAAALLPITIVTGCGNDTPEAPARAQPAAAPESSPSETAAAPEPTPMPEPEAPTEPAMEETAPEPAEPETQMTESSNGQMPPVDPNDAMAQSLGYKHDASEVDAARYPNRDPSHNCANCILYQGAAGEEWGGCPLFPGKVVNAKGWCSSYTPKPA
ncbi:MAG: high-potential iron-sulfur protein [Wenzhouxiangella sp.]|jgi:hypothetical protein|nr:high-potential iron-sulfur protein [Wenzhouxiangella sp.]